jgi:long-chain acyl-CoA synthetase
MNPQVIARRTPDKVATIMASTGETMSYRELDQLARRIAALFRHLGLRPGDHIALLVGNEIMYHPVGWGAWFAGLYWTPISTRLTAEEIAYIIEDSGSQLVVASPVFESALLTLREAMPQVGGWYLTGPGETLPDIRHTAAAFAPLPTDETTAVGADMLYSSGTTGRPKGIKPALGATRDQPNGLASLLTRLYGFDGDSRYLTPAPLYHGSPTKFSLAIHRAGGTNVIMEKFDAEEALAAIARHGVSHSQWVPTMFHRLARLPDEARSRHDLSSHRVAIHAAAPCPQDLKQQMLAWWGPIIHEFYAGSEAIGFTAIGPEEWLARPGSVGQAVLGEIHIMDEDGGECPVGETGEIYFANGPPLAYHNDKAKSAKAYNARGWITLGDLGRLDAEGYLYLSDRKDFMIITGGVNVYPQEIEDVLAMHPEVQDVAVFGIPNEEFGAEVKAVVQPVAWPADEAAYKQMLADYSRARLSPIKVPRSFDLTEELPRQPNGKLYKKKLREAYLAAARGEEPVV